MTKLSARKKSGGMSQLLAQRKKKMDDLRTMLENYEMENTKFQEGNRAAGTRARKWLMTIIKMARNRRQEIQNVKNTA